jgi:HAD superfamily hydrolase (TIGR01484 family)
MVHILCGDPSAFTQDIQLGSLSCYNEFMANSKIKLLALDIDGTLVKEHTNEVSPQVLAALNSIKDQVTVVLVSARAWQDQKNILDQLGLPAGFHVLENGTKVMNPTGDLAYTKIIPQADLQEIENLTTMLCESVGYCVDGAWLQKELLQPDTHQVTTLSLIAERSKAESIPELLSQLSNQYSMTVGNHWSNPSWGVVLISHPDASKGKGLKYVQDQLGITAAETISVGDGASDVPMMEYADTKVAMGNAEEKLKAVATYIAPSVTDNGVVDVIERFILS